MPLSRLCVPLLVAGLLTAGCAASEPQSPGVEKTPGATESAASVRLTVRIADGVVSPVDSRLDARVGQPVEVIVDSDVSDELHVHASPDHTFGVAPAIGQRFRFAVEVPGRVEIELHHAGVTVATLLVRP